MLSSCISTLSIITVLPLTLCLSSLVKLLLSLCHVYSMWGLSLEGRLSGNVVVEWVEHVIVRVVFSSTSGKLLELLMIGISGTSIKINEKTHFININ